MKYVFPIFRIILSLLGRQYRMDLCYQLQSALQNDKLTSEGGFNPHFFALSHLCNLLIPTEGPYLEVISKTLRISIRQL